MRIKSLLTCAGMLPSQMAVAGTLPQVQAAERQATESTR